MQIVDPDLDIPGRIATACASPTARAPAMPSDAAFRSPRETLDAIASTATLTAGDGLNGGAGTDTLNITVTGAAVDNAGYTANTTLTGIEKVLVANFETDTANAGAAVAAQNVTIDLANADTALTTIGTSSSTATSSDTLFTNVGKLVAVEMAGKGDLNVAFTATPVAGAADSLTVTANGVGTSGSALSTLTLNGIETANITSATATNYLSVDGDASLTTVNIAGAQNITATTTAAATTIPVFNSLVIFIFSLPLFILINVRGNRPSAEKTLWGRRGSLK